MLICYLEKKENFNEKFLKNIYQNLANVLYNIILYNISKILFYDYMYCNKTSYLMIIYIKASDNVI